MDNNWRRLRAVAFMLPLMATSAAFGQGTQNSVTPGEFVVEPATLENLGFEWYIDGDANRNATVEVKYRKVGEGPWRTGMNLLRIHNEQNDRGPSEGGVYTAPNMFAGSVLDLEVDTAYEVAFTMKDPDGVAGNAFKQVTVRTRPEPAPSKEGRVYDVYPFGAGHRGGEKAFTGLLDAYYECNTLQGLGHACAPRVKPGDTIRVHAGTYPNDPEHYPGIPFDGTYHLTAKGTAEKPITIIAAGDGPVIFDGGDNHNLFDVMAADYHIFKDITVQNTDIGFLAGIKDIAGSSGLTVQHCTIQRVSFGIWNEFAHSTNFYIADNTVIGRDDPNLLFGWSGSPNAAAPTWNDIWNSFPNQVTNFTAPIAGPTRSYLGIKLYGSGNVVAYNTVLHFHDGIDIDTHGIPEGYPDPTAGPSLIPRENMPVANDFYNNYINHDADNCMEADGSLHNMRQMRNLCFNGAEQVTSSQPTFAGPTYFIRNVTYNSWTSSIKWDHPAGSLYYNNTFTARLNASGGSNAQFYNNLILGHNPGEEIVQIGTFTNYTAFDYNGYRPNDGIANNFEYDSPPFGTAVDYNTADMVKRQYPTLAAYQAGTGQDQHSILIDWNVFRAATPPSSTDYTVLYDPSQVDLTLAPHSVAIDAGMVIPNVTDGFTGKAPDLGAYEFGQPIPHYGPRY